MLNKCKINNEIVLMYGTLEQLEFPEYFKIETIEKDIKITKNNSNLIILSAEQLYTRLASHKRTDDIILSQNGYNTFDDIKAAYFLIRYKKLNASKSIREKIINKYSDIVEYENTSGDS